MENNEIIIDIEEYVKAKKTIPSNINQQYKLRVNHDHIVVKSRFVRGREVLESAGKDPQNNLLTVDYGSGNVKPVKNDDNIDLMQGVVRFMTTPIQAANGY